MMKARAFDAAEARLVKHRQLRMGFGRGMGATTLEGFLNKKWFAIDMVHLGGGNSNIFSFRPYLGKISNLTNIF